MRDHRRGIRPGDILKDGTFQNKFRKVSSKQKFVVNNFIRHYEIEHSDVGDFISQHSPILTVTYIDVANEIRGKTYCIDVDVRCWRRNVLVTMDGGNRFIMLKMSPTQWKRHQHIDSDTHILTLSPSLSHQHDFVMIQNYEL